MSASTKIFDPIRNIHVMATPEERVRQRLIQSMIFELGYPKGLISIERNLSGQSSSSPKDRRFDLLVYAKRGEELTPLLLVECKAKAIDQRAISQAFGYNESIGAPFISLVSSTETITFWREAKGVKEIPFLPNYMQLMDKLCLF